MTTGHKPLNAGVVFLGEKELDIVAVGNRVSNALEMLDQYVTGIRVLSGESAQITTKTDEIAVNLLRDHEIDGLDQPAPLFLNLEVTAQGDRSKTELRADTMLAHLLRVLYNAHAPDYVIWLNARAVISSADFMAATARLDDPGSRRRADATSGTVTPKRPRRVTSKRGRDLPGIEGTHDRLDQQLAHHTDRRARGESELQQDLRRIFREPVEPDEELLAEQRDDEIETLPTMRLSAWFMSFAVALFALPVGAALIVYNLLRGENLRLSSQAAALTGTFIALDSYGATAHAAAVLQALIL